MNLHALPVRRVAKLLNISTHTVYRAIEHRDLPAFKLGGRLFVPERALRALVDPCFSDDRLDAAEPNPS